MRIVLDCANGAGYKSAPKILSDLGAKVFPIGVNPNGLNIKVKDKKIINSIKCKKAIKLAYELIKNKGRLLVRPSGTEPKVRIMCESFNLALMNKCIKIVKKSIN